MPTLTKLEMKAYIGGEWVDSESGDWLEVTYPGDGQVFGRVPRCTPADVDRAVEAAHAGHKAMVALSVKERAELLYKASEIATRRAEEAARVLCMEVGKTITEARDEILQYCNPHYIEAAEGLKRFHGLTLPSTQEATNNKRILVQHEPIGVIGVISPWNWPADIPSIAVTHALAAGNSVIMKPASTTPFSNLILAEIYEEAGFPPGSVNVLPGPGASTGAALVSHPDVGAIHFTGEIATGEELTRIAGIKRMTLELGGNGPLIVMDDANIDAAVEAAIVGCFYLAGQVCTASERILVHKEVHREFTQKLVERTKQVKLGDPLDEAVDMGPLNNAQSALKVQDHIEDAKKKGAKFLLGGGWKDLYFEPSVIDEVTPDMLMATDETFGPVAPIMTFDDIDDAVEIANSTMYGLQGAAFTSSLKNAFYLGENVKCGTVLINETNNYWDQLAPFGGVKQSGLGRELSTWMFDEVTEVKQIVFDLSKVKE